MARFILSEKAERDILEIWAYIAADSVDAADRFVDTVEERLARIAETPFVGRCRDELGKDFRSLSMGNYLIVYRPVEEGIHVARVIHGARDLPGLF